MKVHIFCHPQALPHPPTTSPRDFAWYTCFYVLKINFKLKSKDKHQRTSYLKNVVSLMMHRLSVFVSYLKYQLKVLPT